MNWFQKLQPLFAFENCILKCMSFFAHVSIFGKMTSSTIAIDAVLHSSLIDYELPFGALSLIKRLNPNFLNCWFPIQTATLEEYDKRWETFLSRNIRDILTAYRFKKMFGLDGSVRFQSYNCIFKRVKKSENNSWLLNTENILGNLF